MLAKSPTQQFGRVDAELAIRQIVSNAIVSEDVVDIFAAAGLKKPDISILSDEFLAEIETMPQRNLAVELLQKLLKGEIKTRSRRNVVQARKFSEMIEASLRRYQNRAIETAQVIEELIGLARNLSAALRRGEQLALNEDELAFYDALEVNDSASSSKLTASELGPFCGIFLTIQARIRYIPHMLKNYNGTFARNRLHRQ